MSKKIACPVCGAGHLTRHTTKEFVTYKGVKKACSHVFSVCDVCQVDQVDAEEMKLNKRAVIKMKKVIDGLLTGEEVRAIREKLDILQREAHLIFGGGPTAFSKYEHDDIMQSESMDKLIRIASDVPEAFAVLREKSGLKGHHKIRKNPLHELHLARSKRSWSMNPFFQSGCADVNEQDTQDFVNIT